LIAAFAKPSVAATTTTKPTTVPMPALPIRAV